MSDPLAGFNIPDHVLEGGGLTSSSLIGMFGTTDTVMRNDGSAEPYSSEEDMSPVQSTDSTVEDSIAAQEASGEETIASPKEEDNGSVDPGEEETIASPKEDGSTAQPFDSDDEDDEEDKGPYVPPSIPVHNIGREEEKLAVLANGITKDCRLFYEQLTEPPRHALPQNYVDEWIRNITHRVEQIRPRFDAMLIKNPQSVQDQQSIENILDARKKLVGSVKEILQEVLDQGYEVDPRVLEDFDVQPVQPMATPSAFEIGKQVAVRREQGASHDEIQGYLGASAAGGGDTPSKRVEDTSNRILAEQRRLAGIATRGNPSPTGKEVERELADLLDDELDDKSLEADRNKTQHNLKPTHTQASNMRRGQKELLILRHRNEQKKKTTSANRYSDNSAAAEYSRPRAAEYSRPRADEIYLAGDAATDARRRVFQRSNGKRRLGGDGGGEGDEEVQSLGDSETDSDTSQNSHTPSQLRAELERLKMHVAQLHELLDSKVGTMTQSKVRAKAQLEEANNQIAQLEQRIHEHDHHDEDVARDVTTLIHDQHRVFDDMKNEFSRQQQKFQEDIQQKNTQIAELQRGITAGNIHHETARRTIVKLTQDISSINGQHERDRNMFLRQATNHHNDTQRLETDLRNQVTHTTEQDVELERLRQEALDAQATIAGIETTARRSMGMANDAENELFRMSEELQETKQARNTLQAQTDTLNRTNQEKYATIRELSNTQLGSETTINELRTQIENDKQVHGQALEALESRRQKLHDDVQQHKTTQDQANAEIANLKRDAKDAEDAHIVAMKYSMDILRRERGDMMDLRQDRIVEMVHATTTNAEKEQLEAQKAQVDAQLDMVNQLTTQTQTDLQTSRDRVTALERQLTAHDENATHQAANIQKQADQLRDAHIETHNLKQQLGGVIDRHSNLQNTHLSTLQAQTRDQARAANAQAEATKAQAETAKARAETAKAKQEYHDILRLVKTGKLVQHRSDGYSAPTSRANARVHPRLTSSHARHRSTPAPVTPPPATATTGAPTWPTATIGQDVATEVGEASDIWFANQLCGTTPVGRTEFRNLKWYQESSRVNEKRTVDNLVKTIKNTGGLATPPTVPSANLTAATDRTDQAVFRNPRQSMWYFASTLPWEDLVVDMTNKFGEKVTVVCGVDTECVGGGYMEGGFDGESKLTQASNYLCTLSTNVNRTTTPYTYEGAYKTRLDDGLHVPDRMTTVPGKEMPIDLYLQTTPKEDELYNKVLEQFAQFTAANLNVLLIFPLGLWEYDTETVARAYKRALYMARLKQQIRAVVFAVDDADMQAVFTHTLGEKRFNTFDTHEVAPNPRAIVIAPPTTDFRPWMGPAVKAKIMYLRRHALIAQPTPFTIRNVHISIPQVLL
jgi:hypothetical protein